MRSIAAALLLLLIVALAASGCASRPATDDDTDAPELSLVTLNLWHDKGDWPARQRIIVDALHELQPDVVVLQEVLQDEGLPNQAEAIAAQLGYAYVFASVDAPEQARRFGNAILSRHPILAHDWHRLQPLDDYRNAACAKIAVDGRPLVVYVTHLHWTEGGGAIRATQVHDLLAWIERTRGDAPAVLAGDFNAGMDAPELQPLRAEFVDAYAALHPGMLPGDRAHSTLDLARYAPRHIDQVLLQRDAFEPVEARILFDQPDAEGRLASDHYGVLARFRMAPVGSEPARQR